MESRDAAPLLTDYMLGRLDAHQHAQVEAAVTADPELKSLAGWLQQVQRLLQLAGGAIFGHPAADHLVTFALDPDAADPETAAHAVSCPTCRDTVTATRGIRDDLADLVGGTGRTGRAGHAGRASAVAAGPLEATWRWLRDQFRGGRGGAPFLVGAALAVALMLLLSPVWQAPTPAPEAGATRTLWVASAVRGAAADAPVVSLAGASAVTVVVAAEPLAAPAQLTAALQLRRDGAVAHAWTGPASEAWNADLGVFSFLIPTADLAAGEYELTLALDGAPAVQRTVRVRD